MLPDRLTQPEAVPTAKPLIRFPSLHYGILLLIIAAGAALRFYRLDFPPLWGDEAMVFGRSNSTYQDLVTYLRFDLFGPLHYSLYWVVGQYTDMSPHVMRGVVASWGTAAILGMYLLARQLFRPQAALWAAALAASSAYWMNYSRDCKMYMPTWCLCAFGLAALLWFVRSGKRVAWLAWVAAMVAAMGHHLTAGMALAVAPLALLAMQARSKNVFYNTADFARRAAFVLVGMAIIAMGPLVYYLEVSNVARTNDTVDDVSMNEVGIGWVDWRNAGRDPLNLVVDSYGAYLSGMQYAKPDSAPAVRRSFFYPTPRTTTTERQQISPIVLNAQITGLATLAGLLALGLLPWSGRQPTSRRWAVSTVLLGAMVLLPTYGIYLKSFKDEWRLSDAIGLTSAEDAEPQEEQPTWRSRRGSVQPDVDLTMPTPQVTGLHVMLAGACVLLPAMFRRWRMGWWLVALLFAVGLLWALRAAALSDPVDALAFTNAWWEQLHDQRILLLLLAPLPAVYLWASPTQWHEHSRRHLMGLPWGAIKQLLWLMAMTAILLAGMLLVDASISREHKGSAWMPRYLGVATIPAMLIVTALLLRLPRGLGWLAMLALIAANLTNGIARVTLTTESPVDLVVRDMKLGKDDDRVKVVLNETRGGAHPAGAWLNDGMGKYAAAIVLGERYRPTDFTRGDSLRALGGGYRVDPVTRGGDYRRLARSADRMIVWRREVPRGMFDHPQKPPIPPRRLSPEDDVILKNLGEEWKLVSSEVFPVRHHWNWRNFGYCWRREYQRVAMQEPQGQQASKPAQTQ